MTTTIPPRTRPATPPAERSASAPGAPGTSGASGERGFDCRRQQRKRIAGVGRMVVEVFDPQARPVGERKIVVCRQLPVTLGFRLECRIAASRSSCQHCLAGREIVNRHVVGDDRRVSELRKPGCDFLDDVSRLQAKPIGRIPGRARSPVGQRAIIGNAVDPAAEIERKFAERRKEAFSRAGQRDVDV